MFPSSTSRSITAALLRASPGNILPKAKQPLINWPRAFSSASLRPSQPCHFLPRLLPSPCWLSSSRQSIRHLHPSHPPKSPLILHHRASSLPGTTPTAISSPLAHKISPFPRKFSPYSPLSRNIHTHSIFLKFKSFLKRSGRPFNTDDYSAIFSWIVISNALLIILGTTTFFSLIILFFNTVFAQEIVATKLGEVITKNSKLSVTFESAIVPGWKDGKIMFNKVFVSRRPQKSTKFIKANGQQDEETQYDDGNYTQYDLTIEEINLTLSFSKWVNGKGIVDTCEMKGVRGVIDRTHVVWNPNDSATNYKNVYHPGDFEFDRFKITDMLVTINQPNNFRPFEMEIYHLEADKFRKHWLFYDLLNSNAHGSYDGSLFTVHKRQRMEDLNMNMDLADVKCQRLRINSLSIDHLNRGMEGPFGWITDGKVDMIGDFIMPNTPQDFVSMLKNYSFNNEQTSSVDTKTTLNLVVKLNNVRASVPFQAEELSYINYALIRPIVGYINSHNTYIEINNTIVKDLKDFEGSWTIYDCLLMDDISEQVYHNIAEYVVDEERRLTRMKKIMFWSGNLILQLLLLSIGALA